MVAACALSLKTPNACTTCSATMTCTARRANSNSRCTATRCRTRKRRRHGTWQATITNNAGEENRNDIGISQTHTSMVVALDPQEVPPLRGMGCGFTASRASTVWRTPGATAAVSCTTTPTPTVWEDRCDDSRAAIPQGVDGECMEVAMRHFRTMEAAQTGSFARSACGAPLGSREWETSTRAWNRVTCRRCKKTTAFHAALTAPAQEGR